MMTAPFFGNQAFWGDPEPVPGVGPAPVAMKNVSHQRLLSSLKMLMQPDEDGILMVL